jgi:hypothetical protein
MAAGLVMSIARTLRGAATERQIRRIEIILAGNSD